MSAPAAVPVASIQNLKVAGEEGGPLLLDGVSLTLHEEETVGLVGESGAGKSLTALALLGLLEGVRIVSGQVYFRGTSLAGMGPERVRQLRGARIGLIFQEPSMALDPLMRVGAQLTEVIRCHESLPAGEAGRKACRTLERVGIEDPERIASSYPHQLSGGQRQRCLIALADALEPELLIADEPTSALDVALQAGVLQLLQSLRHQAGRSLLLISHDLGQVAALADRIIVLRSGRIVEEATAEELIRAPRQTYTRQLLEASGMGPC